MAVLAVTAIGGPAYARPDTAEPTVAPSPKPSAIQPSPKLPSVTVPAPGPVEQTGGPLVRSGSKVEVPVAHNCRVRKSLIRNGQKGVPFNPYAPGALNEAHPKRSVHLLTSPTAGPNQLVAALASTSWYDDRGQLQVRVVVLPVKQPAVTDYLQVSVFDHAPNKGGVATRRVFKVKLTGRATCISASVANVGHDKPPVVAYGWNENFAQPDSQPVPLPDTARVLKGRKYLYQHEELSVTKTDELARLTAAALNGEVAVGGGPTY